MAVLFDCCNDKVDFLLVEELGSERDVGSLLGEVDNGKVCTNGENTGNKTPGALLALNNHTVKILKLTA